MPNLEKFLMEFTIDLEAIIIHGLILWDYDATIADTCIMRIRLLKPKRSTFSGFGVIETYPGGQPTKEGC